jgi:signal transduction histidine kinase
VSDPNTYDLEQAFYRVEKEIGPGEGTAFRVIVEGKRMPLHPLIRDEIYRIGREAVVNAFRHARAQQIEVEIDYGPRRLRVLVRDDGNGIDTAILSSGREGHFGLSGMRERAERIGGHVTISSRSGAGTEIELSVPGKIAYQVKPSRSRMFLYKITGTTPVHLRVKKGDGQ